MTEINEFEALRALLQLARREAESLESFSIGEYQSQMISGLVSDLDKLVSSVSVLENEFVMFGDYA